MSLAAVQFETPDGDPVWLDPSKVAAVAAKDPITVVFVQGLPTVIAVTASHAEVLAAIGWTVPE